MVVLGLDLCFLQYESDSKSSYFFQVFAYYNYRSFGLVFLMGFSV